MPRFSKQSADRLATCDTRLQEIFNEVIKTFDCTILEGHRGEEAQNKAFAEGKSKLKWPNGNHNKLPSLAVDVAPFPVDWKDVKRFAFFAGYVQRVAEKMGYKLRWGGDWNSNTFTGDQNFHDLPHFELVL